MITVVALALLVVSLVGVSARLRPAHASDLYAASREISPWWNASAISGEYISAAAFLGMAGLVLAYVKRRHQALGTEFRVGDGPATATIVRMPVRHGALAPTGEFE